MTTVTGDYQLDFTGEANESPWVETDWVNHVNSFEIDTGGLRPNGFVSAVSVLTGRSWGETLRAKIEITTNAASFSDTLGPVIVVEDDSAGLNGYSLRCNATVFNIERNDSGTITTLSGNTLASVSDGDTFELELNTSTGALVAFHNGAQIDTHTDTTYSTGLTTGVYGISANNNNRRIGSFAADGIASSGPSVTSFSSDDAFPSGETAAVAGANLDTVTGATLDGVDVFSGFTDTDGSNATQETPSLTDTQQSDFPSYGSITYEVTDGSTPDSLSVTHNAPSGKQYVTLAGTLNTTESESLIPHESGFSIVADDQMIVDSNATGGSSPAIDISAADGTFTFDYTEGTTYTFDFQFLDVSTNTLYASGTATVMDEEIVSVSSGVGGATSRRRRRNSALIFWKFRERFKAHYRHDEEE